MTKKYLAILTVALMVLGISVTVYGFGMKDRNLNSNSDLKEGVRYEKMLEKQANILNITVEELKTQLATGKTFQELAKEKGIELPQKKGKMLKNGERLTDWASLLGLTVEQLKNELESGKTFLEIAKEKGITEEQLKAKKLELEKARLQELVKAGKITQEQADQRLATMKQKMEQTPCPTCGRGFGFPDGFKNRPERP